MYVRVGKQMKRIAQYIPIQEIQISKCLLRSMTMEIFWTIILVRYTPEGKRGNIKVFIFCFLVYLFCRIVRCCSLSHSITWNSSILSWWLLGFQDFPFLNVNNLDMNLSWVYFLSFKICCPVPADKCCQDVLWAKCTKKRLHNKPWRSISLAL